MTDEGPYVWHDATGLKGSQGRRIVRITAIIAVAAGTGGRREITGPEPGSRPSEAEKFWMGLPLAISKRVVLMLPGWVSSAGKTVPRTVFECQDSFSYHCQ